MEVFNIVIPYLIGSVNFAFWLGKMMGYNVEKTYDENLGAYNLYRASGNLMLAVVAALLDVLKVYVSASLFGLRGGILAYLGHCYSLPSMLILGKFAPTAVGYSGLFALGFFRRDFLPFLLFGYGGVFLLTRYWIKKKYRPFMDFLYHWGALVISVILFNYFSRFTPELLLLPVLAFPAFLYRQKVVFEKYYCGDAVEEQKWKYSS